MSLVVHGPIDDIHKLSRYIRHFQHLVERNGELPAIEEPKEIVQSWTIENKYYSADVKLHLVDYGSANDFSEEYEGLILLPHPEKGDLADSMYSLGHSAADRDVGLRLLVSFVSSSPETGIANNDHLLWAVDHGFEYIEIFEGDLIESHNERDKTGLPRLIEALQSVMWSNAQKKTVPKVKSFVPGDLNSLPPPPQKTLAGGAPENNESFLSTYDEEDEEDMKFFELFAASLAEARSVRDKALSGQLSDADRRAQAAALVRKFSDLMKLESDGEDDEDDL